jgi:hypothetical protein
MPINWSFVVPWVTIITWTPDSYKNGRDDARMELMERLREAEPEPVYSGLEKCML